MNVQQITAPELYTLLGQGLPADSLLVDVRTPEEFARGAIQGARNIPVDTIASELAALAPYKNVYMYCLSGGRSAEATAQLTASDLPGTVHNLISGLLAWRKQGYALVV